MLLDSKIYLASASPRRQELLRQLCLDFEVIHSRVDEVPQPGERPADYVLRVARDKARHVARRVQERGLAPHPVLGADTEVVLDDDILGKPRDRAHGLDMLRRLSGRAHDVLSGLCVAHAGREYTALNVSRVTFRPLTDAEITAYWDTGEPADKAGGYAVQGLAAAFIERIEGSYSGIMGLPLYELTQLLHQAGVNQT